MEKILAGMTLESSSLWAGIHALNLAKRINAHVSFLLVTAQEQIDPAEKDQESGDETVSGIEALIDEGRAEGVVVNYYRACGDFAGELIHFVRQNKITLLVIASPGETDIHGVAFKDFLEKLHHRLNCRMEVVQMKPIR